MLEVNILPTTLFEEVELEILAIVKMCVSKNQNILAMKIFSKISLLLDEIKDQNESLETSYQDLLSKKNKIEMELMELKKHPSSRAKTRDPILY